MPIISLRTSRTKLLFAIKLLFPASGAGMDRDRFNFEGGGGAYIHVGLDLNETDFKIQTEKFIDIRA